MYYSSNELLTKNRFLNFIIGNRGGGKTFNMKCLCVKDFLKNGNTFVWVRRYKTELKRTSTWANDIQFMFPNVEFEIKGRLIYINGEYGGEFIPLSTSQREKSSNFERCRNIVFDEFLIPNESGVGALKYIKDEPILFLELLETVFRMRDNGRVFFVANAFSVVNPYFHYFNITPKIDQHFTMNENCCIELYTNEEYIAKKKKTKLGRLIKDTEYGLYAIENKFLQDKESFIIPRPSKLTYVSTFIIEGKKYGVWYDNDMSFFIDEKIEEKHKLIIVFDLRDLEEGTRFKTNDDHNHIRTTIYLAFERGNLFFSNQEVKQKIYTIIKGI